MKTEVLKGRKAIDKGAELINRGEIVAFPTETVYGLGANAFNEEGVKKIFQAKGRPSDNPLIVHIADKKDIYKVAENVSAVAQKLIEAFMPGPITIVLPKRKEIGNTVTAGLNTVGVRCPENRVARAFIKKCGVPIAAPSANASTRISPTKAEYVLEDMDGKIPLIIDGGMSKVGIESTVVSVTDDIPIILRPGYVTSKMIAKVTGVCKNFSGEIIKSAPAPGMKYKHYAPVKETVIAVREKLEETYLLNVNKNPVLLVSNKTADIIKKNNPKFNIIKLGKSGIKIASRIFSEMRKAEKIYDFIIIEYFGEEGIYKSISNRTVKSAGGKIIK